MPRQLWTSKAFKTAHRVKEDQSICTDQVDSATASLRTEQEDKLLALGIIEPRYDLGPLIDVHGSVEPDAAISAGMSERGGPTMSSHVLLVPTEFFHEIQSLRCITDQDDLVIRESLDVIQHSAPLVLAHAGHSPQDSPLENGEFARVGAVDRSIPAFALIVIRQNVLTARQVVRQL